MQTFQDSILFCYNAYNVIYTLKLTLVTDLPPSTISNKESPENKLNDLVEWNMCQKR